MNTGINGINFPQTLYTNRYLKFIDWCLKKESPVDDYEHHHIFPISVFGDNDITVKLTYREHFIAHLMLRRISKSCTLFDPNGKLIACVYFMSNYTNRYDGRRVSSRVFENMKREHREINTRRTQWLWDNNQEYREKITKANKERWSKQEEREKQSERRKEYFSSEENRTKQAEINREISSRELWRQKRSQKQRDLSSDPEYTKKRIDAMNTPESRKKSRDTYMEKYSPEQRSEIARNAASGLIWMRKGKENIRIKAECEEEYETLGYVRGRYIKPKK